jgi:hypothetical protein
MERWLRETLSNILGSTSIALLIMSLLVGPTPTTGQLCGGCGGTCPKTLPPGCLGGTCTGYLTCQIFGCACKTVLKGTKCDCA